MNELTNPPLIENIFRLKPVNLMVIDGISIDSHEEIGS